MEVRMTIIWTIFSLMHLQIVTKLFVLIELACATCHLIFDQEMYDSLPEKVPEEDDMLDLAFELTDT